MYAMVCTKDQLGVVGRHHKQPYKNVDLKVD